MLTQINKETHVFLKDENSFTSISKRKMKGVYQVYTSLAITSQMADQIDQLFKANLQVQRINFDQGFILVRLLDGSSYHDIVRAIKTVMYGHR